MIERAYGKIQFICDSCESESTRSYDSDDFDVLLDEAKQAGWKVTKGSGEWQHICPMCRSV